MLIHRLVPGPSQNRTWCVTPSGSQFGPSTGASLCVRRIWRFVMVNLRSVSDHVLPIRRPKPAPLRSIRITRLHSYYRYLRLPTASAVFLACYTCPRVRTSCTPTAGYPWLPRNLYVRLDATSDPGVHPGTRPSVPRSVACWVREPIGPLQRYLFRDSTSSGSASPVTFAPRLLLRLRIKRTVTSTPARLNTRPVASGYLGGVRTH